MKKILFILVPCALLFSCKTAPKEAYFNRGEPESLLDISSEVVRVKIKSPASVQEVIDVINKDQPTRAQVSCRDSDNLCREVKNVMHQFAVPVKYVSSDSDNVALIYERLLVRNCQNRYIDNTPNLNNLNHPTLGCSTAINMVQMVSDKHQFTDPALMTDPDANKSLQAVGNYSTIQKIDTKFPTMVEGSSGVTR